MHDRPPEPKKDPRPEPRLELPQELLAEMNGRAAPRDAGFYRVEAFKPSFFGRIAEKLTGRRR